MTNEKPEQKSVKRFRVFRFFVWSFALILIAAGLFSLNLFLDVPLTVSKQTTLFISPIDENGRVDYLKVYEELYYTPDIATDRNGFRQVIQQVDLGDELKGGNLLEVREKLGLKPDPESDLLNFQDPMVFATDYAESDQLDEKTIRKLEGAESFLNKDSDRRDELDPWRVGELITMLSHRPWTEDDLPMMATWLEQNTEVLDIYAKAVRKPVFELPFCNADAKYGLMLECEIYSQHFRAVARGYMARANYFLGKGETKQAIDDIVSCRRLGRHLRNQGGLIQRLVGIAIESLAVSLGIIDVEKPNLTRGDIAYFENQWDAVPPLTTLDHAIQFEKLMWLDALQSISQRGHADFVKMMTGQESFGPFLFGTNWNIAAQEFSKEFDYAWQNRDWEKFDRPVSIWDLTLRHSRSRLIGQWFAGQTIGYAIIEAERRTLCADNLNRITLAMLKYEKDHGCLPPAYTEDKSGKRLHSWRVLLLPYLGETELYEQIDLEEPWDGEHNSTLHDQCPSVFACPSCKECKSGQTSYAVVVGEGLAFEGPAGRSLSEFGKDSDDLILVVERVEPVNWLDPTREIPLKKIRFDEVQGIINYQPMSAWNPETGQEIPAKVYPDRIGSRHPAVAHFGLRNGSVQFFSETHSPELFKDQLRGTNAEVYIH